MLQNILGGVLQAAPAISRRFAPLARIDVHPNLTRERENLEIERQGAQSELALQRAQELAEEHRSKIGLDAENRAILAQQRGDLAEAARIRAENARKPRYNFLTVGDGLFNADLGQWVQMPSSKGKAEDDALREYLDPNTSSERRDLLKGALQTMRGHWDPTYDLGPGHVRTDAAGNPIATGAPIPPRRNPGSGPTPAQQNATKVNEAVGKLRIKHGDNVAPAVDEAKTLYANDPAMFAAVEKQLRQRAPRATQKPAMSPGLRQFLGLPEDGQTAQQSTHKAGDRVSYQGKTYSVKSVNSDGSLVLE